MQKNERRSLQIRSRDIANEEARIVAATRQENIIKRHRKSLVVGEAETMVEDDSVIAM